MKNMPPNLKKQVLQLSRTFQSQKGVVLLESLIAILLFSLGILALAGLQAAMLKNTSDAQYRAEATFIAQQKLGEMWVNAKNKTSLAEYAEDDVDISSLLPAGKRNVDIGDDNVVTVTVSWQLPGSESHNISVNTRIEGI